MSCDWIEYHPVLKCGLVRIDVEEGIVQFYLPEYHCTDMAGAIKIAKVVNPGVRFIQTISGKLADATYQRGKDGKWVSLHTRAVRKTRLSLVDCKH